MLIANPRRCVNGPAGFVPAANVLLKLGVLVPVSELADVRAQDLLSTVGDTPLLRLNMVTRELPRGVDVFVKAEHLNPGGSVKDRPARAMILDGLSSGKLKPGHTILDATSGNTGLAYAMMGAALGFKVALCIPGNASEERLRMLKLYGAEIIATDPAEATDGSQRVARELAQRHPDRYFYPDQYNNDANWRAHYDGTGVEIWSQTNQRVTHFVAGTGTTGTFVGTARRLKHQRASVHCVMVQPDSPWHGLEGVKHLASSVQPGIFDSSLVDETIMIVTEAAQDMTRRLAREEGLLVGVSSGANVLAAVKLAARLPADSVVVSVLCDNGARYLSDPFWNVA